ncbi:helix-turn-helix domain-containing protein [Streptomyces sp. NBC_01244]|uniref:helix-turn-helix domain-containing protein n=1 Tax=Streptomyces sp. NBC_01244 TaxID=2903797 RepID=UPI002E0E502D|nr:AraC family transcriptional regulator [Streptomyces sp. NBC_01244]
MDDLRARPAAPDLCDRVLGYRPFRFDERAQAGPPREAGAVARNRHLIVPDGVVKVTLGTGAPVSVRDACAPGRSLTGLSLAAGVRTTSVIGERTGPAEGVSVLLTPLGAYRLFGVPMSEWSDWPVAPEDLNREPWTGLPDRLAEVPDVDGRCALLDRVLRDALASGPAASPEVAWAWQRIKGTAGRIRIEVLAARTGWSRRHLERRFRCEIGVSPKAVAQVMRLQEALRLKGSGADWAGAAMHAGYHDQPHFDRVFKSMTGCTPTAFIAHRTAASVRDVLDFVPGVVTSAILSVPPTGAAPAPLSSRSAACGQGAWQPQRGHAIGVRSLP